VRLSFLLLPLLVFIAAFGPESSAQKQWKDFLVKPSANTYGPLSAAIRKCVVTKCHDADIAGSGDNLANLYKLLDLAETGNHYAMEIDSRFVLFTRRRLPPAKLLTGVLASPPHANQPSFSN